MTGSQQDAGSAGSQQDAGSAGSQQDAGSAGSQYKVVWPRSRQAVDPQALADRPDTLAGKTVAFLWDDLFRGDEIFPVIAEELQARYEGLTIIGYEEFGSTHGERESEIVAALPRRLRDLGVDAVVSGMAC